MAESLRAQPSHNLMVAGKRCLFTTPSQFVLFVIISISHAPQRAVGWRRSRSRLRRFDPSRFATVLQISWCMTIDIVKIQDKNYRSRECCLGSTVHLVHLQRGSISPRLGREPDRETRPVERVSYLGKRADFLELVLT